MGIDVGVIERKGFLYNKDFKLLKEIPSHYGLNNYDIVFTFEHPKNYYLLPEAKLKIGFLVYEFTTLPEFWVHNINRYLDLVFVPSKFTFDVFLKSGVSLHKLRLLRYGFNPQYYYPFKGDRKIKNFLTISSPHKREALSYTLKAFYEAFKDNDAKLTIKLSYISKRVKRFEDDVLKLINEYKKKLGERLVVIDKVFDENEMGNLYRENDIYFSLSKSESFGLCFLEALACGLWVIAINYSGQMDFVNNKNSFFINYYLDKTSNDEYERILVPQYIAYPDLDDAVEKLKKVYNKVLPFPEIDYNYYRWQSIAQDFLEIIRKII